jgi:hypothetical protein
MAPSPFPGAGAGAGAEVGSGVEGASLDISDNTSEAIDESGLTW